MFANFARYTNGKWRVFSSYPFPKKVYAVVHHYRIPLLAFASSKQLHSGAFVNPAREHLATIYGGTK
jgi:hypothetical protein